MNTQLQQQRMAAQNRQQFASANHGRPAVVAETQPIPQGKPIAPVIPARAAVAMPAAAPNPSPNRNPPAPAPGRPGDRIAERPAEAPSAQPTTRPSARSPGSQAPSSSDESPPAARGTSRSTITTSAASTIRENRHATTHFAQIVSAATHSSQAVSDAASQNDAPTCGCEAGNAPHPLRLGRLRRRKPKWLLRRRLWAGATSGSGSSDQNSAASGGEKGTAQRKA